jgi:rhodanese-related sulfurtransferase
MKKLLTVLLLVLLFTGCKKEAAKTVVYESNPTKTISCPDMEEKVKNGALLIDVRNPDEYNAEHIDNAINIPSSEIEAKIAEYAKDRYVTIILYCQSGVRANQSAIKLMDLGYKNVYSLGGIRKCKK